MKTTYIFFPGLRQPAKMQLTAISFHWYLENECCEWPPIGNHCASQSQIRCWMAAHREKSWNSFATDLKCHTSCLVPHNNMIHKTLKRFRRG